MAENDDTYLPRIVVSGVGGAGCNTVNRLAHVGVKGAELLAFNTDRKHLNVISDKTKKYVLGDSVTHGLGAGGYPEVALKAAELSRGEIEAVLEGTDLMFLAAGMGGGTGTGAAPVIADVARKQGAIVIAIVTYPFLLERARLKRAEEGIENLRRFVDTIVVIDNNRLVEFVPNLPIEQAFNIADEITARAVRGIAETITTPSLINLDFSDVKTVMSNGGVSMIAVGESKGSQRGRDLVSNTLHHRLLDVDYRGSTGVLLHITGSADMTLGEANQAGEEITAEVDPNANVIWGARLDPTFDNKLEAFAIFTGIKAPYIVGKHPVEKEKFSFELEGV
ncbi:Cell division protein FtsZ 1 [Candidatus Burarchaeum australiense]|nr:Cell division protein FtsZ 1 [Candidatus Burarchaeum australiense]